MPKKILIVDDSATVRNQVSRALQPLGLEVLQAEHGDDALAKLNANEGVELVVSDINMPWKDGMELLAEIREDAKLRDLPVVLLTAEINPTEVEKAKKLGISGWIVKPFEAESLVAVVQSLLP